MHLMHMNYNKQITKLKDNLEKGKEVANITKNATYGCNINGDYSWVIRHLPLLVLLLLICGLCCVRIFLQMTLQKILSLVFFQL